jgi:DNA-directed RNA polymerase subunit RPC12/RpoP
VIVFAGPLSVAAGFLLDTAIHWLYIEFIPNNFLSEQKTEILSGLKVMPQENKREIIVTWELTCHQCKSKFEVPAPFGPREERELNCPRCGSKDIERMEALATDAPQCGG